MALRAGLAFLASLALLGCGNSEDASSGPSTAPPPEEREALVLELPSVGSAPSSPPPLGTAVSFVPCAEADAHVGGALEGSSVLVTSGLERVCYIEAAPDGDPRRHAGALIIPGGYDAESASIIDVARDGITVLVSSRPAAGSLAGTDPTAPGGGYAEFSVAEATAGRVVRLREDSIQAMYVATAEDGEVVKVDITSNRSAEELIEMARAVFEASG